MRKAVINYGLISGAISAALMFGSSLMLKNIGFDYGYLVGYTGIILSFLVIYPGVVSYREKVGSGKISFGRALAIGLLITAISCICYTVAWIIVNQTIFPDFMDKYGTYVVEGMKKKGATAAEISAKTAEMQQFKEMYKNPLVMFLMTFIEPLPVGIIISVVSAFIARTKTKP